LTNAGFSPIFAAAQKGNLEILQLLLEERADVNLNAKDGRTPLYAACERGNEAIASRLIRLGVKVDAKRTDGSTALIAAVCSPSPQTLCIPSVVYAAERVRLSRREVPTYIV
jgi:ankyrin repeat protein